MGEKTDEEHDAVRDGLRMPGWFRDDCVNSQMMVRQVSCWGKNLCESNEPNESLSPCVTMLLEICGPLQSLGKPLQSQDTM